MIRGKDFGKKKHSRKRLKGCFSSNINYFDVIVQRSVTSEDLYWVSVRRDTGRAAIKAQRARRGRGGSVNYFNGFFSCKGPALLNSSSKLNALVSFRIHLSNSNTTGEICN